MKKIIFTLMFFCLFTTTAKADTALDFTKSTYQSMTALNTNDPKFSDEALNQFKSSFNFAPFNHLVIQDFETKLTPEEKQKLQAKFSELFFANFRKRAEKLALEKITNPTYQIRETTEQYGVVQIKGNSTTGEHTINFYVKPDAGGDNKLIDLEIDSVLLSRNYRGSFNRIFREKGASGLYERMVAKLNQI